MFLGAAEQREDVRDLSGEADACCTRWVDLTLVCALLEAY